MKKVDPELKFRGALLKRVLTKNIVLHHAGAFRTSVFNVHQWHLQNGWAGIGYHYYVTKDGIIYIGRPEWTLGSHCKGYNYCSIGICCEGNYAPSSSAIPFDKTMPMKQYNALVELIEDIKSRYSDMEVKGHKELYPTVCPGKFYPLEDLKAYFNKQREYSIIALQELLKKLCHYKGQIDGVFGPLTIGALKDFQEKNHLLVTGKVESETLEKLKYFGL